MAALNAPPANPHPWAKFRPAPLRAPPLPATRATIALPFARGISPQTLSRRTSSVAPSERAARAAGFHKPRAIAAPTAPTRRIEGDEVGPLATARAAPLPAPDAVDVTRAPWGPRGAREAVSDALADALHKLAAEAAVPVSTTNAPFLTAAQRDQASREARLLRRRYLLKRAGLAVAALIVIAVVVTQFFFLHPSEDALAHHAQSIATTVLPLYSNPDQPLRIESAEAVLRDEADARHHRYAARIVLRVTKPLYEPGNSNGTVAYLQMRAALEEAKQSDLKNNLIPRNSATDLPALPPLLQVTHHVDDLIVVTVPFTAERTVRIWRLSPPDLAHRTIAPTLHGAVATRFTNEEFLVVGSAGGSTAMREKQRAARAYILAVTKEEQRLGIVRVRAPEPKRLAPTDRDMVVGLPSIDPNAEAVAAPPARAINPDAPAINPNAPAAVNPDAPAVNPDAPAINPDAPAVDPNAPAVAAPEAARTNPRPTPRR